MTPKRTDVETPGKKMRLITQLHHKLCREKQIALVVQEGTLRSNRTRSDSWQWHVQILYKLLRQPGDKLNCDGGLSAFTKDQAATCP